jgi:hypothetical protein
MVRQRNASLGVLLLTLLRIGGVLGFLRAPTRSTKIHISSDITTSTTAAAVLQLSRRRTERRLHAWPLPTDTAASVDLFAAITTASNSLLWIADTTTAAAAMKDDAVTATAGLSKETAIAVFIVGLIPFGVATVEFWRRIAVGASFGTTADPVVFTTIGEDDAPVRSRGKRVLGKDALVTAYILFAVAATVLGIVLFAVATSPVPY